MIFNPLFEFSDRYIFVNIQNFDPLVGIKARETIIEKCNLKDWISKYEFLYKGIPQSGKKRIAFIWYQNVKEEDWKAKEESIVFASKN